MAVNLEILDASQSQLTQNEQVKNMIDKGCDVVCVNLVDRTDEGIEAVKNEEMLGTVYNDKEGQAREMLNLAFVIATDKLAERFSAGFIQNCVSLWDAYRAGSIVWKIAQEADASALYAMGEGGFLSALWKMAEASEVGLEADFRKVPIRQETIEVCEIFDLNPYKLQADGAVLIGIRGGEALVQRLRNEGFVAEVIGQTNSGNDRLLYSGGSARYLERPAEDELQQLLKE